MQYKTIAVIDEPHHVYLVQDEYNQKIYVRKVLDVYNAAVYEHLYRQPVEGIPRIIYYEEEQGRLVVIEEYISGDSLEELMAQEELTNAQIVSYMLQLCQILERLHSLQPPVIHRDIKPSNLIITTGDKLVLLDFNAAKHFDDRSKRDTVLLGTNGYAAPEQYGFGSSVVQTDIYAAGVVLRELTETTEENIEVFVPVIEKCTQMKPEERYASASELAAELRQTVKRDIVRKKEVQDFIPPGYRTGTPWKMITATVGYLSIVYFCLTLHFEPANAASQWIQRVWCLILFLTYIAVGFNYLNIRSHIPYAQDKRRIVRYVALLLCNVIWTSVFLVVLAVVEEIFFPGLFATR